ncbi:MAG: transposase [Nitrospiraceae bacterium]|nr:transposase [Nitrospiraceae bacterium]
MCILLVWGFMGLMTSGCGSFIFNGGPTTAQNVFCWKARTGKTAITYYLEHCFPKFAFPLHPQLLVPDTIQIPIEDLRDSRQKPFKTLMSCLRRALTDEALSFWVAKSFVGFTNFPSSLTRERNFIEDFDFDGRFLKFLEDAYTSLNSGNEKDWLKQMSKSKEILSEADGLANKHGLQAILMIDRIDEAWDGSDKSVLFLMALMHACIEISSQATFFRPLLFLRENIFERVRQIDNEFSRLETCVISLDWSKELLLELVERRLNLPFNTRLPLGGETWDYFFESTPTFSSREKVFVYCQERPRDILTYCTFAVESAQAHLRPRVTLEDLEEAKRRFSQSRLKDLGDEYSENYPQIQIVLSRFYGLGKEYTVSGVDALIKKLLVDQEVQRFCQSWIYLYVSPEKFIEILYNVGFWGIRNEAEVEFRSMGVRSTNPPKITGNTRVVVHPSYVDALNLQDAIVADLSHELSLKEEGIIIDFPQEYSMDGYQSKLEQLSVDLKSLEKGRPGQSKFEDIVGEVIRLCFYRSLVNVETKVREVDGTIIRDWVASNVSNAGFWERVRSRYQAVQVIWECKNYDDLKADDFHQAAYYMSRSGGKFVALVFRGDIKNHYFDHIKRISLETDGIVLLITEKDLMVFLRQSLNGKVKEAHIQGIYDKTIRQIS